MLSTKLIKNKIIDKEINYLVDSFYSNIKNNMDEKIIQNSIQNNKMPILKNSNEIKIISNITKNDIGLIIPKHVEIDELVYEVFVRYDKTNDKFLFYNKNKKLLGFFTTSDLIIYISSTVKNTENKYIQTVHIIETYIVKLNPNNKIEDSFNIISYINSPFMGDINMLILLNNSLLLFEKTKLENTLFIIDKKYRKKKLFAIKYFINLLLNYTLSILLIISNKIKNDNTKTKLKKKIIEYSITLLFRINKFVQTQLNELTYKTIELNKAIVNCTEVRIIATKKIDNLNTKISYAQKYLTNIFEKIDTYNNINNNNQYGGCSNNSNSSSNTQHNMITLISSPYSSTKSSTNQSTSKKSSTNQSTSKKSSTKIKQITTK